MTATLTPRGQNLGHGRVGVPRLAAEVLARVPRHVRVLYLVQEPHGTGKPPLRLGQVIRGALDRQVVCLCARAPLHIHSPRFKHACIHVSPVSDK